MSTLRIEDYKSTVFTIFGAQALDPITVAIQDLATGQGRLMVECYGRAWSTYWGAMGNHDVSSFVRQCGAAYVVDRLWHDGKRMTKREEGYLTRIVEAVQEALKQRAGAA